MTNRRREALIMARALRMLKNPDSYTTNAWATLARDLLELALKEFVAQEKAKGSPLIGAEPEPEDRCHWHPYARVVNGRCDAFRTYANGVYIYPETRRGLKVVPPVDPEETRGEASGELCPLCCDRGWEALPDGQYAACRNGCRAPAAESKAWREWFAKVRPQDGSEWCDDCRWWHQPGQCEASGDRCGKCLGQGRVTEMALVCDACTGTGRAAAAGGEDADSPMCWNHGGKGRVAHCSKCESTSDEAGTLRNELRAARQAALQLECERDAAEASYLAVKKSHAKLRAELDSERRGHAATREERDIARESHAGMRRERDEARQILHEQVCRTTAELLAHEQAERRLAEFRERYESDAADNAVKLGEISRRFEAVVGTARGISVRAQDAGVVSSRELGELDAALAALDAGG